MKQSAMTVFRWIIFSLLCHATQAVAERPLHVLLQGDSSARIAELVETHGGSVTHNLHIIDAVGARVTSEQLETIVKSDAVARYLDDLSEYSPPEEDQDPCRVRGHIELIMEPTRIVWRLYNKQDSPATWEQLQLAWPEDMGRIESISIGGKPLEPDLYAKQSDGALSIDFGAESAPSVGRRADLVVRFRTDAEQTQPLTLRQRDFDISAQFNKGDCSTELVPGYQNNHQDYYYNTVAGVEPLHLQGVRGQGISVAVVDSGLWEHPALMKSTQGKDRVLARYDAIRDIQGREVVDESGHGTHMSSIIANSGPTIREDKATGSFKGVAPDANLVAVKILDRAGQAQLLDIVRAIQWVVDNREKYAIRILNLSFSQQPRWHYWEDPVNQAVMRAWESGIVVVVAAGNEGPEPMTVGSPGNLPYVITVGAVTDSWTPETRDDDYIPDFSSRGPTPSGHVKPDIVALGGHMTGLIHPDSQLATEQPEDLLASGEYVSTGSSQAAALVSGIAALLLQLEPDLTPDDIKCKLTSSAEPAINRDGRLAYSPFQQGFGYVTASRAVILGETGCGNSDLDLHADITGEDHYFGPAVFDEKGNASLPGFEDLIATQSSEKGMSKTRKWGVKAHVERMDGALTEATPLDELPFDWRGLYLLEKATIERLARGAPRQPDTDQ